MNIITEKLFNYIIQIKNSLHFKEEIDFNSLSVDLPANLTKDYIALLVSCELFATAARKYYSNKTPNRPYLNRSQMLLEHFYKETFDLYLQTDSFSFRDETNIIRGEVIGITPLSNTESKIIPIFNFFTQYSTHDIELILKGVLTLEEILNVNYNILLEEIEEELKKQNPQPKSINI